MKITYIVPGSGGTFYCGNCLRDWYFTDILKNEGRESLDKSILKEYWSGNMQRTDNMYDKAVQYLRITNPEYNWDTVGNEIGVEEFGKIVKYTYQQLKDKLYEDYQSLKNRKKVKCILKVTDRFDRYYYRKLKYGYQMVRGQEHAKIFNSIEEAKIAQGKIYHGAKGLEIVKI